MKKKILSMMLVAAMTVGTLAGCGSNSGNGNSEKGTDKTADAGEEVTIQFMHMQVEQERQDVIAKLIEEFEAENPGIKVKQKMEMTMLEFLFPDGYRESGVIQQC